MCVRGVEVGFMGWWGEEVARPVATGIERAAAAAADLNRFRSLLKCEPACI